MNFSYYGSGTLSFQGCSKYRYYDIYPYKFRVGEVVFYKPKAIKGKLEKIIIKNVKIVRSKNNTKGQVVFVYQDTLNSLYNEWDLLYKNEAIKAANKYYDSHNYFSYTGSGGVRIKKSLYDDPPYPKFSVNQILFYKPKALKGKLEKIVVEKVKTVMNLNVPGEKTFLYIDTLHSTYNEYDLVTETQALELADEYYEKNNYFAYIGTGKISVTGNNQTAIPIPRFNVGNTLFLRTKAERGKLEKIVVKDIRKINNKKTNGQTVFMYVDTLQSIYNQYDLVTETEALIMAKTYFEAQAEIARNAINPCRDW